MKLTDAIKKLDRALERAVSTIHGIGSGILAVMMLFTAADVALRYFFGNPIKGDYEISAFMMSIVIPSGLALCAWRGRHIRVDVFTMKLPPRVQAGLSSFVYLITLGLLCLMVWQGAKYASVLHASNTAATSVPIPHYPFVIVVTICLALFALVALRHVIDYARQAVTGKIVLEPTEIKIGGVE